MSLEGSGASRAGGDGFHNEDAFLVEEGLGLYVVCDGDSEGPAGEVAANVAASALEDFMTRTAGDLGPALVERAMTHALAAVADVEQIDPDLRGLSTTVTMLLAHKHFGIIGHRGDSRAYLIRRERAHQLTVDHELTESTSTETETPNDFETFSVILKAGDTIVLCTDGAENVVLEDTIVRVAGDLPPRVLASRIVSAAHKRSPEVDATAVVVRVLGDTEPAWLEQFVPANPTAQARTLAVA